MSKIFLEFIDADREYASELREALRVRGLDTWIADQGIIAVDRWADVIEEQIDQSSALVVIMSEASQRSAWLNNEMEYAVRVGTPVFPVLLSGMAPLQLFALTYIDARNGELPVDDVAAALHRVVSSPRSPPSADGVATSHLRPPVPESATIPRIFISYSHADEGHRQTLEKWLGFLVSGGNAEIWHDRKILPGEYWSDEIDKELRGADIILLLLSIDFFDSDFIQSVELAQAMKAAKQGSKSVIPIILRPCPWDRTDLAAMQVLPVEGRPVDSWGSADEAWFNVYDGIEAAVQARTRFRE